MTYRTNQKNQKGFTLIELLIVVMILGILTGLAVPRLAGRTEWARAHAAKADIDGGISLALDLFELDMGRYPENLEALIQKPGETGGWQGPYLKHGLPKDPWGNFYIYQYPGSKNTGLYDLLSAGPDRQPGTPDDILLGGVTNG